MLQAWLLPQLNNMNKVEFLNVTPEVDLYNFRTIFLIEKIRRQITVSAITNYTYHNTFFKLIT